MVAASTLAAGCGDVLSLAESRVRNELAILLQQATAPAPGVQQFVVANSRTTERTLIHADQFNTTFAVISFPQGSLATIGGQVAAFTDSTQVSVQSIPGTYGVQITANATFSPTAQPTLRFVFGSYGDFTQSRMGSRYTSNTAYAQALSLWREVTLDRFSSIAGSGPAGTDAVSGSVTGPGYYVAAALK